MKSFLSAPIIGGIIGIAYFCLSLVVAFVWGGDTEGTMVIAQMLNMPITLLFAALSAVLPVSVTSNFLVQFAVGVFVNFFVGMGIGWLLQRWKLKKLAA